jgi:hypothetical protein
MTPEVVPGGFLDESQWRTLQNYMTQVGNTLNQLILYTGGLPKTPPTPPPTPPTPWPGTAVIWQATGFYGLAPDDDFVVINLGGSSINPAAPNYLQVTIPLRSEAIGPVYLFSGDDTLFVVNARTGDRIVICDIVNGAPPTYVTTTNCGDSNSFVCTVFAPLKDSATDWVKGDWTIRDFKV